MERAVVLSSLFFSEIFWKQLDGFVLEREVRQKPATAGHFDIAGNSASALKRRSVRLWISDSLAGASGRPGCHPDACDRALLPSQQFTQWRSVLSSSVASAARR